MKGKSNNIVLIITIIILSLIIILLAFAILNYPKITAIFQNERNIVDMKKNQNTNTTPILKTKAIIINGNSMYPAYKEGERTAYVKTKEISRYDVVVYKQNSNTLIKRVYGIPNESFEIKNGKIYINDSAIDDIYAYGNTYNYGKIILNDDEFFVLGDNREISLDSRSTGPIKLDSIMGKLIK